MTKTDERRKMSQKKKKECKEDENKKNVITILRQLLGLRA
jgi:hypothetical protein